MAPSSAYPVIAVVNGDDPTYVWHIDCDPLAKTGQLVGAWTLSAEGGIDPDGADEESWAGQSLSHSALPLLVRGRAVVVTPTGARALDGCASASAKSENEDAHDLVTTIDMQATCQAMKERVAEYKEAHRAENARRKEGKKTTLKGLSFPEIPPFVLENEPDGTEPATVRETLRIAHSIRDIVTAWNEIDALRRSKANDYLADFGDKTPQAIPLVSEEK